MSRLANEVSLEFILEFTPVAIFNGCRRFARCSINMYMGTAGPLFIGSYLLADFLVGGAILITRRAGISIEYSYVVSH